ncbi:MAG: DegT/DnrJ/EryC1/StrS family aminotransferase [Puniceicoccales bacterium]|jgi:dTDP-4-amino-4,6-dideoxygalactose transaminase|nr:DegT/DnrJ/EryC1/StrS family aminotransferase [Puniceicoccales bacterium]
MAIYVTKSFLPKWEEYERVLEGIWERGILTNQGPCVKELESKMRKYLGVENFHYLTNGTIALQLALDALNIKSGEVITTPFSYVATASSILWERCKPVFVDIEPDNFTIDADKIESAIAKDTKAIMAVHVFGYPCNVEKIQQIAGGHNLKIIYDGAHAFGANYEGKSLLSHGDVSTCSFHATKLFHTVEGGACVVKDKSVSDKLELSKRCGHQYDEHIQLGINGKQSEFHAAMGLANFPHIPEIIADRKRASEAYDSALDGTVERPKTVANLEYNYAYYPVVFANEDELKRVFFALAEHEIYPRRYFYPSLNALPYVEWQKCPLSENISSRIACLPLFVGLENETILQISEIIRGVIK